MADFFETLKADLHKGAEDIKNGWDHFKDDLKDSAESMGEDERQRILADDALYSWSTGNVLAYPLWDNNAAEKDTMMKTMATIMMKDDKVVSPCNGVIGSVDEDSNTIAIVIGEDIIVAVKVCTGSVDFSKDAKILVKQGDAVKAGQTLVQFDKELEAKSKLLLVRPDTAEELAKLGFKPTGTTGEVKAGQPLVTSK